MQHHIKDIELASQGHMKIEWARRHMPVLSIIEQQFKESKCLEKHRIAMCLHLEAKTACLGLALKNAGATISMCGSNPLSTQDDVTAALVDSGIPVFAWRGESEEEYKEHLLQTLDMEPDIIIDDGGDLITMIHQQKPGLLINIIGGCEETTTGIRRLKAMEADKSLKFPVIAVNDGKTKYLFDNRYGTGQSTMDSIMRTTNLVIAGKTLVVSGYGWCGRGIAMRGKGLGSRVIVTEVDPVRANEALMDGYSVMPIIEASREGDIFVTTTGCKDIITKECFKVMKDGALLANAGHFDVEISKPDLAELAIEKKEVRKNIEEYLLKDGRRLYLLGEGRLTNLAAGDGHPVEIMDLSFALQALGVQYISENGATLKPKVISVPEELDTKIAFLRLEALGIKIDELTTEQKEYIKSWQL